MKTTAFQKIFTKIDNITKATCTLEAAGVSNEEMAYVDGRPAQVVRIMGNHVVLQVFPGYVILPKRVLPSMVPTGTMIMAGPAAMVV